MDRSWGGLEDCSSPVRSCCIWLKVRFHQTDMAQTRRVMSVVFDKQIRRPGYLGGWL
jgi:hypothetical protein